MSGSSNKQTTTTSAAPYKAAQPLLDRGMGDALNLYKSGNLVKPNTMSTVVPFSRQTAQGMNTLQRTANHALMPGGYFEQMGQVQNLGGFTPTQRTALEGIRETATGDFDINANPAYAGIRQRAMDAAGDAANSTAAGLGRYASGTHQGVLAREVGNVAGNMDFNEYNNWQNRRSQAQDRLFNAGQTGLNNLGQSFDMMQGVAAPSMQLGAMNEDLMGRQMNDQLRISNELQNLPLANIQALLAASSGAGNFGSQTQTAQGPNNSFSNILGAGLGGLSLLGAL